MALSHSPKVVMDDLVLYYDMNNKKSWKGSSVTPKLVTNLVDNKSFDASNLTYNEDESFSFNGSSNYLNFGSLNENFLNFTVEVVFKSDNISNYRNVLDCNYETFGLRNNTGPRLEQTNEGVIEWFLGNSPVTYDRLIVVPSNLNSNVPHHVAITRNFGTISAYYNGNLVQSIAETYQHPGAFDSVYVGIGFDGNEAQRWFDGNIPLLRIYKKALTASEVSQNFQAIRGRYGI